MTKTPVIIVPEIHTIEGQKVIEKYVPLILDIFLKNGITNQNVLNYTEGDYVSDFYKVLYNDGILLHVKEKTIGDDNPDIYNSIKHGLIIINLIRNTFDYYKKIRINDPTIIPIGLSDLPMDSKYIKLLAYNIYELQNYVSNKKHKYYAYMNAAYQNIINNESIEKYEEYIIGMLNEVKPFFTDYLMYFNFYEMIDTLILSSSIESRSTILNQYSIKLRAILDTRVIHFFPKIIKKHPNIKMIVMVSGEAHLSNLYKLIRESDTLIMEPEFLEILTYVYKSTGYNALIN
jgi:hypothetical protein